MNKYLLCCDWGTTSFRLRLVSRKDQMLIGEITSPNGISQTHDLWKQNEASGIERITFFKQQLKNQKAQVNSVIDSATAEQINKYLEQSFPGYDLIQYSK